MSTEMDVEIDEHEEVVMSSVIDNENPCQIQYLEKHLTLSYFRKNSVVQPFSPTLPRQLMNLLTSLIAMFVAYLTLLLQ